MAFYAEMAAMARDLLKPDTAGGLGQGTIVLSHKAEGAANPAEPWTPVAPIVATEQLRGAVRGIDRELVGTEAGGTVLLSTDRHAICEVPTIPCEPGDVLTVDGIAMHILIVEKIPAAGTTAAVRFILRG